MFRVITCLTTQHDWRLLILACLVGFIASLCAIGLFHRALRMQGHTRATWIACAGCAAGFGIWTLHFIAMLAYEPGVAVGYDVSITALSLLVAVAFTCSGFAVAGYRTENWAPQVAGALVGVGIAALHYLGMWALELPGHINW